MSHPSAPDVLRLGGTLPGPGWAVLDAARDQRFTGELVAEADLTVHVYFDRGRIYVAERATDPPLGTRLVEAGALNEAQLEYGSLRVGDIEHLGRLFDRVPSVDRDGVLVLNELMTEECVRWLAATTVRSVLATPYRHHPSGMHRWDLFHNGMATPRSGQIPHMALPAPHPDATPVATAPPEGRAAIIPTRAEAAATGDVESEPGMAADVDPRPDSPTTEALFDDVVAWDEPSSPTQQLVRAAAVTARRARRTELLTHASGDAWIDDLDHDGVAGAEVDGGAAQSRLPSLPVRPVEEFELIWPSGETDDVVDADEPLEGVDHDRVGPTARVPTTKDGVASRSESDQVEADAASEDQDDDHGSSQLAVRRAVATIDTGSLEARRRLADVSSSATSPPGRVVVQREGSVWRSGATGPTPSVFDEQPVEVSDLPDADSTPAQADAHDSRTNALRRLIGSLRRA